MKTLLELHLPESEAIKFAAFCVSNEIWTILSYSIGSDFWGIKKIAVFVCVDAAGLENIKQSFPNELKKTFTI
jgi:hypothetical protein